MSVSNPQQWKIDEKQSPAAYRLPPSPPRHPSSPAMSATPVAALIPGEGQVSAPKKMERQGTAMDSEKGTIELEAESNWSKEPQLQCRDETERNDEEISNDKYANTGDHSKNRDELIVKLKEDAKATKDMGEIYKDAKWRDKIESRERKWSEEVNKDEEKCRRLEVEKMDLEVAARSDDQVVEKLKAAEAEIEALKSLLGYKDGKIAMLVKENERLGKEKMKIKEELHGWVLQMEEAVKRFTGATYASHVGKQAKGNGDLQSSVNSLDWKKRLEEDEKMKGEFLQKIGVLEKERGEMEAEVWKLEREISGEKEKVLNNMTAMEAKEKKIMELVQRIEVLEKENRAIEANHANREKSEIERILKEKMDVEAGKRTVKEEVEKEIFQLVHRIGIFEKEKRDLEEEIRQKDEVIQVLVQENDCLEDKIKKLNTEINKRAVKSKEDAELPQRVHLANNGCILGTPTQNQGQKSAGFPHSDEHKRSLNYGDVLNLDVKKEGMMNFATACESKRPLPENLSGGRSSEDTVSFGRFGNSSIAKRSRPSMINP